MKYYENLEDQTVCKECGEILEDEFEIVFELCDPCADIQVQTQKDIHETQETLRYL